MAAELIDAARKQQEKVQGKKMRCKKSHGEARMAYVSQVVDLEFVQDFIRMCDGGWQQGWHERNGGNASYRLAEEDIAAVKACLGVGGHAIGFAASDESSGLEAVAGEWIALEVCEPFLAHEWLLITATGSYMQNVVRLPEQCLGLIELNEQGDAYRVVWGFEGGGRPTSEVSSHVMIHSVKSRATEGASRVLYHCHPTVVNALCLALPHDAREWTRTLWKTMTECMVVFPEGIGMVSCHVPGSLDLARETAVAMEGHNAAIWAHHGLCVTGGTCDEAFGLAHVVVKAAQIYESACTMCAGPSFKQQISDEDLLRIAQTFGLTPNPKYL